MMTRDQVKRLKVSLQQVLDRAGKDLKYKFTLGAGRFGTSASFKLECVPEGADSTAEQQFKRHCAAYGLKPTDLGKTFRSHGKTFKIVGLEPRRPKFPVIAEYLGTGTVYKFSAETVGRALSE